MGVPIVACAVFAVGTQLRDHVRYNLSYPISAIGALFNAVFISTLLFTALICMYHSTFFFNCQDENYFFKPVLFVRQVPVLWRPFCCPPGPAVFFGMKKSTLSGTLKHCYKNSTVPFSARCFKNFYRFLVAFEGRMLIKIIKQCFYILFNKYEIFWSEQIIKFSG